MIRSETQANLAHEIHGPSRKRFPRSRTIIKGIFKDLWQIDLIDLTSMKDNGYKFLLSAIDTGSKLVFLRALKSKRGEEVARALESIFRESKFKPRLIHADKGKEFYNKHVNSVLNKNNIRLYSTFSDLKASIIERANRTIKTIMFELFSATGNHKWVKQLPDIAKMYNTRVHRSIGMRPADVRLKHEKIILKRLFPQPQKRLKIKFKIGDIVRISKLKTQFEKRYLGNWGTKLYKITAIRDEPVPSFYLADLDGEPIKGRFYNEELKLTKYKNTYLIEKIIKKRGNQMYVKWLGFAPHHNSWINKRDIA